MQRVSFSTSQLRTYPNTHPIVTESIPIPEIELEIDQCYGDSAGLELRLREDKDT